MSLLSRLIPGRRKSATKAKERLQIIISQQRFNDSGPDYLALMKNELLSVIEKYVTVNQDQINIEMETHGNNSTIALSVTLPDNAEIQAPTKEPTHVAKDKIPHNKNQKNRNRNKQTKAKKSANEKITTE
jgi:cell division topological specificity factor